jgi:N-acetylglutamate synthase-like GNAT family acetyltransferase
MMSVTAAAAARIRRARLSDVDALARFISAWTTDGTLLPRTRDDLVRHLGDFRVALDDGVIVGCGALQPVDAALAEIRTVAVEPACRGAGIGGRIVRALMRDARRAGIERVFCLTRRRSFFARLGFHEVPREVFPHKIWNDCLACPRLSSCDEVAMLRRLPLAARKRAVLGGEGPRRPMPLDHVSTA